MGTNDRERKTVNPNKPESIQPEEGRSAEVPDAHFFLTAKAFLDILSKIHIALCTCALNGYEGSQSSLADIETYYRKCVKK